MHSTAQSLMNIQHLVNMMVDGFTLPTVSPTAEQPKDAASLTSWAVARSKALRPDKILRLQQQHAPRRLVCLNTRARQGRSNANRLDFTRPQNIDAIFIYIYGTLQQESPCDQCRKGRGIFQGCVTLDGMAAGACANCAYSSRGRLCHFHHHRDSTADSAMGDALSTLTAAQWQAVGDLFQRFAREQAEAVSDKK